MTLDAPFAEDLTLGEPLSPAPDITIDSGLSAQYLAIVGDQLRPALSDSFSRSLTGSDERLANPALVISASIGQSTVATRRVIANLQYRNLTLSRPVHVGETLRTIVTPLAASWTREGNSRAKVLLGMALSTAEGELLSSYERLALLPVADPDRLVTGEIPPPPAERPLGDFGGCIPRAWAPPAGQHPLTAGDVFDDPLADTVSSARELVRMTQNRASAHRDYRAGLDGRRLVYGGHTVGLAQASLSRVLPDLLTVVGWRSCDHVAPVFEEDLLTFSTTIDAVLSSGSIRLADATVAVTAHRSGATPTHVLEWKPILAVAGAPT